MCAALSSVCRDTEAKLQMKDVSLREGLTGCGRGNGVSMDMDVWAGERVTSYDKSQFPKLRYDAN